MKTNKPKRLKGKSREPKVKEKKEVNYLERFEELFGKDADFKGDDEFEFDFPGDRMPVHSFASGGTKLDKLPINGGE